MLFKNGFHFCVLFFMLTISTAFAGPWLSPGNLSVKSDIDLLSDAGLIKAPVMTWPIAWVNIGPQLLSPETKAKLPQEPAVVQEAYQRIVTLYQHSYQPYQSQQAVYASASNRLNPFRTFQYEPYSKFASGVSTAYQMKHFAESANISYYSAPNQSYSNDVHIDNSYAYLLLGNWAIGFDQFNRWWGPGYSDAMVLSQNAEPFPALGIQRMHAEAFQTKWLHWIGPWSVSSVVSENGAYNIPGVIDNELFWFTNVSFRPLQSLQFDVSRNVLFAGQQRPLNSGMFLNLITFRNSWANIKNAPGSEEWDIGTTWSLMPRFNLPLKFYQQTLFSDEGGNGISYVPNCTTFLLGSSLTNDISFGTLRTYFEYEYNIEHLYYWWGAQTGATIAAANPYGGQYPYYYYSQLLSSSLGSEGIGYTLGFILNENRGSTDTATIRFLEPNSYNWGTSGTFGYPYSKQDLIWTSISRSIVLPHRIGSLNGELGYLMSVYGNVGHLASGFSVIFTWSKNI